MTSLQSQSMRQHHVGKGGILRCHYSRNVQVMRVERRSWSDGQRRRPVQASDKHRCSLANHQTSLIFKLAIDERERTEYFTMDSKNGSIMKLVLVGGKELPGRLGASGKDVAECYSIQQPLLVRQPLETFMPTTAHLNLSRFYHLTSLHITVVKVCKH